MLCLPPNYKPNNIPEYCTRPPQSVNWQQSQYKFAAKIASDYKVTSILDIGAGDGIKLLGNFDDRYTKYAIEYGENFEKCKNIIPNTIEYNLESHLRLDKLLSIKNFGIICIDVIEHLINPIPLLESLIHHDECKFIFITTPERELIHGIGNMGPPTNKCHVHEWTLSEFQRLIKYYCLVDPKLGLIGNEGILNGMYAILK